MKPTDELPDDPALPGLRTIREMGLASALPDLALDGHPAQLLLCGYSPGVHATLEVRTDDHHVAVKAYAEDQDPAREAALYSALADVGLAGDSGPRVPRLLASDRDLRLLVLSWLEGPTVHQLVKDGQGERAGELVARWLRCVASLSMTLGSPRGAAWRMEQAGRWLAALSAADPDLRAASVALAGRLAQTQPEEGAPHLVHGSLYDRHVLDVGDGPGVIDWGAFGQGPLELDAGIFLATISRIAIRYEALARDAERAKEAFMAGTLGLLDERALAWHEAMTLLRLASNVVTPAGKERLRAKGKHDQAVARAHTLLREAERRVEVVG
jgi:aminoglycoside phosphotransferase (APT) family kinase protein